VKAANQSFPSTIWPLRLYIPNWTLVPLRLLEMGYCMLKEGKKNSWGVGLVKNQRSINKYHVQIARTISKPFNLLCFSQFYKNLFLMLPFTFSYILIYVSVLGFEGNKWSSTIKLEAISHVWVILGCMLVYFTLLAGCLTTWDVFIYKKWEWKKWQSFPFWFLYKFRMVFAKVLEMFMLRSTRQMFLQNH
jgi:hypothetical protein